MSSFIRKLRIFEIYKSLVTQIVHPNLIKLLFEWKLGFLYEDIHKLTNESHLENKNVEIFEWTKAENSNTTVHGM